MMTFARYTVSPHVESEMHMMLVQPIGQTVGLVQLRRRGCPAGEYIASEYLESIYAQAAIVEQVTCRPWPWSLSQGCEALLSHS